MEKYYSLFKKANGSNLKLVSFVGSNLTRLQDIAKERKLKIEEITEEKYILIGSTFMPEQIIL